MTASMDLFNNMPRTQDGGLLGAGSGLQLHFHEHVDLHITVVRHEATGTQRLGMEIGGPVCSETAELPATHPANVDPGEQWLMKHHPAFAAYSAKLRRELEAAPATSTQAMEQALDDGEPTDEEEAEDQAKRRWPFGRRRTVAEASV